MSAMQIRHRSAVQIRLKSAVQIYHRYAAPYISQVRHADLSQVRRALYLSGPPCRSVTGTPCLISLRYAVQLSTLKTLHQLLQLKEPLNLPVQLLVRALLFFRELL